MASRYGVMLMLCMIYVIASALNRTIIIVMAHGKVALGAESYNTLRHTLNHLIE